MDWIAIIQVVSVIAVSVWCLLGSVKQGVFPILDDRPWIAAVVVLAANIIIVAFRGAA